MTSANTAFLFPGQGSQYPGMGKDLFAEFEVVRDAYAEASEALGYDIARLSFDDPDHRIDLTRFTQPALLTHSIACCRAFAERTDNAISPSIAAGHSLGEYSALVVAGALSFAAALRLVKARGELMGEYGAGEMAALMIDYSSAAALAEQHYCAVAARNLPSQNVVGGRAEDLDALVAAMAEKFPGARAARLKTEGAFHTYYMVEAATRFRGALADAAMTPPRIEVLSNFTGGAHDADVESIKSRLFLQLFNPVLWHKNLATAAERGAALMIEFGGGLGKGQSAAEKRPNLESIVKQAFRGADSPPDYLSVINLATLREAAAATA